jgi:murein DD-endopeptidase MepM/ murein hydrolase activator NlpD
MRAAVRRGCSRAVATGALVVVLASLLVAGSTAPAFADEYPSWQDVQAARASEAATAAEVTRIEHLIADLQVQVTRTQAAAVQAGEEYREAQAKFDDADMRLRQTQERASALQQKADAASTQAARLAAELYRAGGGDLTANLLLTGSAQAKSADSMLDHLAAASKVVEKTSDIYRQANLARNTAKAMNDQAASARAQREALRAQTEDAFERAQAAAEAAASSLAAQQSQSAVLDAQLAALKDKTAATVEGYEQGVIARAAAAAAAARAAAQAAAGAVGGQGWAVPVGGPITDGFGPRASPCPGCTSYHLGADIGAGCGAVIHAAHAGTVTYAGWNGGYGNYVQLSHGGGVSTGYGHIVSGGILVGNGQNVDAGEPIARVGSTGNSTGCHLHFEVRINGSATDPIAFMAQHGASLG